MFKNVYSQANAFVMVCAVNNKESFTDYDDWFTDLNIQKKVPIFLIGNKIDLPVDEHYIH